MSTAIGVDVGGTAIKAVLISADGDVIREFSVSTPKPDPTGELTAAAIAGCVTELAAHDPIPVGFSAPGLVDEAHGVVVDSVNLNWQNVPIRDLVEARLGRPVGFIHDVRAGGLAEITALGDRDPAAITAFVAVGTGMAAAIYLGQRPLIGNGWVGEIGQIVFTDGPHTGKRIEQVASAAVLAQRMGTANAKQVADLVVAGDPRALELWDDTAKALALGLAALVATIAPNLIILGGGLAEAGDLLFAPTARWLERLLPGVPLPPLRPATHGQLAGALGAAQVGRSRLESTNE